METYDFVDCVACGRYLGSITDIHTGEFICNCNAVTKAKKSIIIHTFIGNNKKKRPSNIDIWSHPARQLANIPCERCDLKFLVRYFDGTNTEYVCKCGYTKIYK